MSLCGTFQVTGQGSCIGKLRIADRLILVPRLKADGTENTFANIAAVTKAALVALIEDTEPQDAAYVLPRMDNVVDERSESEPFEWESGKLTRIDDGIRAFEGYIEGTDTELLGRLESFEDKDFGYYEIDKDGNFVYNLDSDGVTVKPIPVDGNSFKTTLMLPKYKEPGMIKVNFSVDTSMEDKNIRWQSLANLDFDGRTSDIYGLLAVTVGEVSVPSTSAYVVDLKTDYDVVIQGQVLADFTLYNNTQVASVTITGVTESTVTPGDYSLAYSSGVSASDILKVTYKATTYEQATLTSSATV